jgi:hypothetical protein
MLLPTAHARRVTDFVITVAKMKISALYRQEMLTRSQKLVGFCRCEEFRSSVILELTRFRGHPTPLEKEEATMPEAKIP